MGRILSTYLGRTSVPRELTEFEMREYFTLSAADKRALPTAVRTRLRLAVALQLGFLRMTGTTLDAFDYVPRDLLEFVARQVGRPAPMLATLRGLYRRRMSLFRHQSWALEHLGLHRYGPEDEASAIDALVSETRATVDRDRLAGRVRGFLYVQRCCIPGPRVIADLVRRVLREVESRDAEALRVHIGAAACAMWYERLMELRSDGISWLEWVRRPPARRSPKSLRNAIGKLLYLCEFPRLTEGRSGIPPERLRAYGRRLRRRKPAHLKAIVEPRRTLEIAGFLQTALGTEADRVLRLVEMRIAQIWRAAHARAERSPQVAIDAAQLLSELSRQVSDPTLSDTAFRERARMRLQAWASAGGAEPGARAAQVREALVGDGRRIRRLLKDIVALRLGGAPLDPVLKALRELESSYKDGWLTLFPEAAVPFARPWQALVNDPDRERAFRAYEAATLWGVRRGLRSGALYLSYAQEYRGKERLLLPAADWNARLGSFCLRRDLPAYAEPFLQRLVGQIDAGLSALDEAVRAREASIDAHGVHLRQDPAVYSEPSDADVLRQRLYARVGRVQLPELLLAVDSEARFSSQLLGREPRSAEELVTLYAAVLAAASNLDATTMALMIPGQRPGAIRRAMALLEEEHALRRANDAILERLRALPLVNAWGDGYEASADLVSLDTSRHLWAARVDPKRRRFAVGTYAHILDQWGIVYDQPLLLATRQSGAAIEGAVRQSVTRIERLAVDTHGYTDFALACAKLLGFDLCPRLRSMRDRKLHLPRGVDVPESIALQAVQDVSLRSIHEHWSSLLRVAATIEEGWSSATQLLERFGSAARGEDVYRAGNALGQLLRTIYLCDYFTLPDFRRGIHRILDRGESVHALQRMIHSGSIPVSRGRDPAELGVISGALTLVTNAVMTWNATRLQRAVEAESAMGESRAVSVAALSHIGPVAYAHINFRGTYRFPVERYAARLIRAAA
jgi:TnpA family transposase